MTSLYEIEVQDATGQTVSLQNYAGEVLLIVNTASKCGLVGQFGDFQRSYYRYVVRSNRSCTQLMTVRKSWKK